MAIKLKKIPGGITAVNGFKAAGIEAAIKKQQKKDLALLFSERPAKAAAVFTRNLVKAAPLKITAEHLKNEVVRAVVINSGVANACTGLQGEADARETAAAAAQVLGIAAEEVLVASTGVIGVPLPMKKVKNGIRIAAAELSPQGGAAAAAAIMTTDLRPKEIAVQFELAGKAVTIGAMAKGSGMIHPNMATMLAFVTVDVNITKELLHTALQQVTAKTFNMITVDGDTSTNDMLLILSNCAAANPLIDIQDKNFQAFTEALETVCVFLAKEICRDGEGATKLVEIEVCGAKNLEDARRAAKAVANSNLVKTAIFGEDANWGRVLAAAGYSGADFDPEKVNISIESAAGREVMALNGQGLSFDEEKARKILQQPEIKILIDLGGGSSAATAWTCDFSYDYVRINADYRT